MAACSAALRCLRGIAANSAFTAGGGLTFKSDHNTMNECGEVLNKVFSPSTSQFSYSLLFFSLSPFSVCASLSLLPFFFVPHLKLLEKISLKAVGGVNISGSESGKKKIFLTA